MSDTSAFMEPRNLTNLKNRPRSGSWSGYQYYRQQQQQQQKQQQHYTFLHENKTAKPSFLSKFIQKKSASTNVVSNDGLYKDDESLYVNAQTPPLLPTLQQPMLSTPLLKEQDHTSKRKKGKTLGRFLKKLGKNTAPTLNNDAAPTTHIVDDNNNNEHDSHAAGGTTMEPSQMQVHIVHNLETQASDHSPNPPTHQNSIRTTTSMDSAVVASTPIKAIHQQQQQKTTTVESTKDDIQLHYYRVNDMVTYAPLMPRSTSFDFHRSSPPPSIRFFAPDSEHYYAKLEKCASLKDARVLITETYGDRWETGSISPTPAPEQLSDTHSTTSNTKTNDDDDDDDDDSTNDSIDSDMDDDTHAVADRLSKRLSGGHFGSAGGLIVNTLSLSELSSVNNNDNINKDEDHDIPLTAQTPTPTSMQPPTVPEQQDGNHDDDDSFDNSKSDSEVTTLNHAMELATPCNDDDDDEQDNDNHADADNECGGQEQLTSLNSMDGIPTVENTAEDYARRIWEQDDTVYSSLEHVVEWIGNGSPASRQILTTYMSYFDFTHIRLEDAFRQLCGKLSMRAESQQIDRILEEFSKRYWDCNQQSIFGNADIIHAVVYSLVLLNTDLHVAQGERKKMSRPAFIQNTMNAIRSQLTTTDHLLEVNNNSTLSLDDDKLASNISLQSQPSQHQHQHQQQEWNDLKRTPSCRSNYSQTSSSYRGKVSSTFDMSASTCAFGSLKWQGEMESLLKQMYISIRHKQIMHPQSKQDDTINALGSRQKNTNGHRYGAFGRNVGTMVWKMARDSLFISDHNIAELDFSQPLTPRSTVSSRSGNHQRRRSISSMRSGISQHSQYTRSNSGSGNNNSCTVNYQAVASLLHHSDLPSAYTSVAPYYKEGMIVRKHLMEQANQKARQRDWKECFMVVDRGEIRMYRLESHGQSRKNMAAASARHPFQGMISRGASLATVSESISSYDQSSISSDLALGGGDWLTHAQMIGEIDLKHTLSNALPSGYSRQRRHAFALQQANGGVYLFQVGSEEQVLEWVTTCNYWAARESKEPLMGAVGNLEYGWSTCLDGMTDDDNENDTSSDDSTMIYQWRPPVPPMVASNLGEKTQLGTLLQHIKTLNDELDRHRDVKRKMERRFYRKTPNHICAMSNFENKTQYLLHEIIKYQNYCDSIEKSLALQDKAIHEEQQKQQQFDIESTAATLE